jgi:hypothetical protein
VARKPPAEGGRKHTQGRVLRAADAGDPDSALRSWRQLLVVMAPSCSDRQPRMDRVRPLHQSCAPCPGKENLKLDLKRS